MLLLTKSWRHAWRLRPHLDASADECPVPYVLALADKGYVQAMKDDPGLLEGLNVCHGHVTNQHVADDNNYPFEPPQTML